jgi:hypothetical protein
VWSHLYSNGPHSHGSLSLCVACVAMSASSTHKHSGPSLWNTLAHKWDCTRQMSSLHRATGDDYRGRDMWRDWKHLLYKELKKLNWTPWPESASELYRPSDCSLSAKLVPTLADRGCHVYSCMRSLLCIKRMFQRRNIRRYDEFMPYRNAQLARNVDWALRHEKLFPLPWNAVKGKRLM